MSPSDPLSDHFRLVASQQSALKRLRITTIEHLLRHFPVRYDIGGSEAVIQTLVSGAHVTVFGTISRLETRRSWKRKIPVGEATITDSSGSVKVMWFHQPYLAKKFSEGMFVKAVGTVSGQNGKTYLANPHVEIADPTDAGLFSPHTKSEDQQKTIFPVYPESRGITSLWFRHALERVLASGVLKSIDDPIPEEIRERYHLPSIEQALLLMHTPEDPRHAETARKRFAFEEILAIQVARARERHENNSQAAFPIRDDEQYVEQFLTKVPYTPTGAQRRAIADILSDFGKPHPMARLLEGDVGSGKTLVAAACAYAIVRSRPPNRTSGTLQVAYMAPTEILATQHFQSFIEFFKDLPINIALMTGSGCKKFPSKISKNKPTDISRAQLLKWVANGEIAMIVGTHALIQKSVQFQHLALCIVDEQHRFGTRQRMQLAQKNRSRTESDAIRGAGRADSESYKNTATNSRGSRNEEVRRLGATAPHFLSMTATPIPRTLALTLYGDLDLSILDELPPGRARITTKLIKPSERSVAYTKIREELEKGRQAYVICPRIEEPDPENMNALQAKSVKAEAKRLEKDIFPEYEIGLLHGAMKPDEKDAVMKDFADGTIRILVATSVVEVGINVPNATVILIEGAERFGLAQLHQLRGRVQRSSHPPYCFLLPESKSQISMKRLRTLEQSDDGFKLAEADLESRGAGDLFGRQQWGVSDLGMEALKNVKLIKAARDEAQAIVSNDPTLHLHLALRQRVDAISNELHSE